MNRVLLQSISKERRREAAALLRARLFAGAYYLAGYSVECALKACIAKQTRKHDFPDKRLVLGAWTHDVQRLALVAGVWPDLEHDMNASPSLQVNWGIVTDWSEDVRYDTSITEARALALYAACTARHSGILTWIRSRW